jgi:hypothetical protein
MLKKCLLVKGTASELVLSEAEGSRKLRRISGL